MVEILNPTNQEKRWKCSHVPNETSWIMRSTALETWMRKLKSGEESSLSTRFCVLDSAPNV